MATAPEILLREENSPECISRHGFDVDVILLDKADQATEAEFGGDFRTIPAGDQMGRILVQNMHMASAINSAREKGDLPIACLGTCSGSLGVIAGLGRTGETFGLVWFDAHGDADTPETSSTGFIEGMVTSVIAGKCWTAYSRSLPGFRPIPEAHIISVSVHEFYSNPGPGDDLTVGTAVSKPTIDRLGYETAMSAALDILSAKCAKVYVHVDTDVLDPTVLRSNLHSAPGGLTDDQVNLGLRMVADRFEILAVSFSSWDPAVEPRGASVIAPMIGNAALEIARSRSAR